MRKLRIGELSGLVGANASALRFWEERGITEPEKDSDNSYRLYSAEDSCRFLMARRYRSFGFSVDDAKAMIGAADPEGGDALLARRLAELDDEARRALALRDELARYRRACSSARREVGRFEPDVLPASSYIFTIERGAFVGDSVRLELSRRWTDRLPFASFALYVPREAFSGARECQVSWGFGLGDDHPDSRAVVEAARAAGMDILTMEARRCVRTAFYRDDPRDMRPGELSPVADAFREAGYEASGPAIGHLLELDGAGDSTRYLYALYIPV
ncbi:MAG: MerR family transcriptional regulator [Spirochaetaceae bacterium]|nr:MerR family transcriptional regulator [Spirochaetaceae bacterium]